MDETLEQACADLAPEWIGLSNQVRHLAATLKTQTRGTPSGYTAADLAAATEKLCDHVEQLRANLERLLRQLDAEETPPPSSGEKKQFEIECASIDIQREAHEVRTDLRDIIKALFLWRDDPVERLREKE